MTRRLGIEGETLLIVETTEDGAILLRPAGVYPIEIYSDERLEEFASEDQLSPSELEALRTRPRS